MLSYLSIAKPKGRDSGLGALTCSNVSKIGSNFVIPGPVCSDIHNEPDLSNNKANGSFNGTSGTNSVISKVLESTTPILPANASANHTLPPSSTNSADGPDYSVSIVRNLSKLLVF